MEVTIFQTTVIVHTSWQILKQEILFKGLKMFNIFDWLTIVSLSNDFFKSHIHIAQRRIMLNCSCTGSLQAMFTYNCLLNNREWDQKFMVEWKCFFCVPTWSCCSFYSWPCWMLILTTMHGETNQTGPTAFVTFLIHFLLVLSRKSSNQTCIFLLGGGETVRLPF